MERKIVNCLSSMFVVMALFAPKAFAQSPIYVGVIENIQDAWHPDAQNQVVRVGFEKQDSKWVPLNVTPTSYPVLPDSIKWTVVFDGRNLGQISSQHPSKYRGDGGLGVQEIVSPNTAIPKVAADAGDFSYIAGFNRARTRPLLVVSAPNYRDPEKWKRTTLNDGERKAAIDEFRKKVPQLEHCDEPESDKQQMLSYADNEIILVKAYRSNSDELLYGERLDDSRSGCEFFDDDNFFDYWFARTKDGAIHFLGTEMMPIDAADLDGDGSSEWVFHTSRGEDEEGYELVYGDFSETAYFHWSYH